MSDLFTQFSRMAGLPDPDDDLAAHGDDLRDLIEWEACGLGICAAPAGHEGTCAEASGWVDEDGTAPSTECGWRPNPEDLA
jgi:3-deoxy-D-manno-octulosonate 8-phosphate phosphatase KdsC-like HAD superfamily phosphatase